MKSDVKNNSETTNLIFKVLDGKVRVLCVMNDTDLAKKYVKDLNNSNFALDGEYAIESVPMFDDVIPFYLIEECLKNKSNKKKYTYAEVVGNQDCSEVRVLNISTYSNEPKDYQDANGLYHVFFEIDSSEVVSPTLYRDLVVSFCDVVSVYKSRGTISIDDLSESTINNFLHNVRRR